MKGTVNEALGQHAGRSYYRRNSSLNEIWAALVSFSKPPLAPAQGRTDEQLAKSLRVPGAGDRSMTSTTAVLRALEADPVAAEELINEPAPGFMSAIYSTADLTRNTRAHHFTPQHWLLCHMGFY